MRSNVVRNLYHEFFNFGFRCLQRSIMQARISNRIRRAFKIQNVKQTRLDSDEKAACKNMNNITETLSDTDQYRPKSFHLAIPWLTFNLFLFVLYVGFFHLCLLTEFPTSLVIGLVIAGVMVVLCWRNYRLFTNRYEFFFYLSLPLDVALESLIPIHSGYSFYWCAASFWSVFILYRVYRLLRNVKSNTA